MAHIGPCDSSKQTAIGAPPNLSRNLLAHSRIVVHAEAHGSGYEGHLLALLMQNARKTFAAINPDVDLFDKSQLTADSGFHSKVVLTAIEKTGVDTYIAGEELPKSAT